MSLFPSITGGICNYFVTVGDVHSIYVSGMYDIVRPGKYMSNIYPYIIRS